MLSKARAFSTVDLKSGYWHCILAPEFSVLTTFATPYGTSDGFVRPLVSPLHPRYSRSTYLTHWETYPVFCASSSMAVETNEEATANHNGIVQDLLCRFKDRGIIPNPHKMKLRMSEVISRDISWQTRAWSLILLKWRQSWRCQSHKTWKAFSASTDPSII